MAELEHDDGRMSFFEHLAELRTRIIWSLIPAAVGLAIALYFTAPIMRFLQRPITGMNTKLVFTTPTEAFWTYMKVAMIAGLFVAMPVVLWNVWAFVAPGLHEERMVIWSDETTPPEGLNPGGPTRPLSSTRYNFPKM